LYKDPEGKTIAAVFDQLKPDLVGVTSLTGPAILDGLMVSRLAKERGAQVVWGGTHASLLPEQTLQNPYIDFVVMNEGEVTFRELIEAIELHRGYKNILGLAYKENGEIQLNPERPFIQDLDALPMPAWNLVPVERYIYKYTKARRKIVMVTSRGCLFRCSFCYVIDFHKRKYRGRSAGSILKELAFLRNDYGIDGVRFDDDLFVIHRPRLREFCEWVYKKDVPITWDSNCRADQVNSEFLAAVTRAKCHRLTFGLESGSDRILKFIEKDFRAEQIVRAFDLLNNTDIMTGASFLIGVPTETEEDIWKTIEVAKRINAYHTHFYPYTPFPGSPLAEYCRGNGLIQYPDRLEDWADFEYARSDRTAISEKEIKKISAQFEVRNVLNSLQRGELAILSNFLNLEHLQNFGPWASFFRQAFRSGRGIWGSVHSAEKSIL